MRNGRTSSMIPAFKGARRLLAAVLLAALPFSAWGTEQFRTDPAALIGGMNAAYAGFDQYQCEVETREYHKGKLAATKRFVYSFKKPNQVRVDMVVPYRGMTLIYPDDKGKVLVKPGGRTGFLSFRLSPDSALLKGSAGQRLDQTDLGLLIRNIAHSLTDWRQGEAKIEEEDGRLRIEVLSLDHFIPGVRTLYRYHLDRELMLPVEVEELTAEGVPRRTTVFRNLRPSTLPGDFFRTD